MFEFSKQSAEAYSVAVEFDGKLPSGASLNTGVVSMTDPNGTDTSATMLSGTGASVSGTQARIKVQGGTHGVDYRLRFLMTLTNSDVLEEEGIMHVREVL